ncbi:hypothetical protein BS78_06G198100 [Paspalum vaginatum]|nr:hypothetical protein BS78_06G198100 [Paspalum vaginatum]
MMSSSGKGRPYRVIRAVDKMGAVASYWALNKDRFAPSSLERKVFSWSIQDNFNRDLLKHQDQLQLPMDGPTAPSSCFPLWLRASRASHRGQLPAALAPTHAVAHCRLPPRPCRLAPPRPAAELASRGQPRDGEGAVARYLPACEAMFRQTLRACLES